MASTECECLTVGNTLLCLTTLRHRRFVEDAIHIIGLPHGAHVRLRYRRPYVMQQLWDEVRSRSSHAGFDQRALIALGATRFDGTSRVAPLREGRIVFARCEGSILVLDIALGDFVTEKGRPGAFWDEITSVASSFPSSFEYQPDVRSAYIQRLNFSPLSIHSSAKVSAWERVATAFFELDAIGATKQDEQQHSVVPFLFYVSDLKAALSRRLDATGAIDMEAGERLAVEVHTMVAPNSDALKNPLGEVRFELSHSASSFESSRRVRIDSRRDVRTVRVTTTALFRRVGGHLSIRTIIFQDDCASSGALSSNAQKGLVPAKRREELVIARYDFPLKVGRCMPWVAGSLVSLSIAAAVFRMPESGELTREALLMPALVFVLALVGIVLGLRNDSKR